MNKILFACVVSLLFMGCGGENKLKVTGTLEKHHKNGQEYFTVKDDETSKLYRIAKKSEASLEDRLGHRISMKVKVLEESSPAQGVETIASCTKCHHSIKEL